MKIGLLQGDADGFCGLYAILNFLAEQEDWSNEKPNEALGYLLRSVRDHGWLSPYCLIEGFESWQIKRIIDDQFDNYRMPFRTLHLQDAFKGSGEKNFFDFASIVIAKGGSILGGPNAAHWLLLTTQNGKPVTVNSADRAKSIRAFDKRCVEWETYAGVVILPAPSPSATLD